MVVVGCGLMLMGLLLGALSGSMELCLAVGAMGAVITACTWAHEQAKERRAQAWRRQYPTYRY